MMCSVFWGGGGSNSGTAKSAAFYSVSSGPLLITQLSGTTVKHLKRHYCRGKTIYSSHSICSSKLLFGPAERFFFPSPQKKHLSKIFCFPPVHKALNSKNGTIGNLPRGWTRCGDLKRLNRGDISRLSETVSRGHLSICDLCGQSCGLCCIYSAQIS